MDSLFAPLLLAVVALSGLIVGVVVVAVRRVGSGPAVGDGGSGSLRIDAVLHTGVEQVLVGLARELALPVGDRDVSYGQLYLEQHGEQRLVVQSRSAIDRGLIGVIDVVRRQQVTQLRYALVRLPADDNVVGQVAELEYRLVSSLRRLDAHAVVRSTPAAARTFAAYRPGTAADLIAPLSRITDADDDDVMP